MAITVERPTKRRYSRGAWANEIPPIQPLPGACRLTWSDSRVSYIAHHVIKSCMSRRHRGIITGWRNNDETSLILIVRGDEPRGDVLCDMERCSKPKVRRLIRHVGPRVQLRYGRWATNAAIRDGSRPNTTARSAEQGARREAAHN